MVQWILVPVVFGTNVSNRHSVMHGAYAVFRCLEGFIFRPCTNCIPILLVQVQFVLDLQLADLLIV